MRILYLHRTGLGSEDLLSSFIISLKKQEINCFEKFKLLVILKGIKKDTKNIRNLVTNDLKIQIEEILCLPDDGYDLGAYFRASNYLPEDTTLFLNSHSRFRKKSSLQKIYNYSSFLSNDYLIGCSGSLSTLSKRKFNYKTILFSPLITYWNRKAVKSFPEMPNPHIRTTGFVCNSKKYSNFISTVGFPKSKEDCHFLESGNNSLTNYFQNKCLVSEHGIFQINQKIVGGFRNGNQENLLISDNQTDIYDQASSLKRRVLSYRSYG
ncbi:hypothetical protein OAV71_05765 [Opitutales bacterium]|nr:hypothetical protein [Opitutales bacterium]